MEVDVTIPDPERFDVLGTPTVRTIPDGYEITCAVMNRGPDVADDLGVCLIARDELANVVDFMEVRVVALAPGESRPARLWVEAPDAEPIVTLALQLTLATATVVPRPAPTPALLQPLRPAEPAVAGTAPLLTAREVPFVRHATEVIAVEDSAQATRMPGSGACVFAEVSNLSGLRVEAARLQVVGYDSGGRITAFAEAGPWPLEPGQTRVAKVILEAAMSPIATVGLFPVWDEPAGHAAAQ